MDIGTALQRVGEHKQQGGKWRARCPAHGGDDFNLEIRDDGGRAYFTCYSHQCDHTKILEALGDESREPVPVSSYKNGMPPPPDMSEMSGELVSKPKPKTKPNYKEVARYDYTDEDGGYLFHKVRLEDADGNAAKSFRAKRGDDWSIGDVRRVLYNLPAVIASPRVFIVEGEKDADRLNSMGLVATCNFDGASMAASKPKWLESYNEFMTGKVVYIIPDNDDQGRAHADHVKNSIATVAETAVIITLDTGNIKGGDVSDWLGLGNTKQELIELCEQAPTFAHQWNIKTLADVDENRTPTEYIIDPILPVASLNIWYGASGSKKSLIIKDMCFTILTDGEFVAGSNPTMPTKKVGVLWLDMDNGDDVMDERIAAFRKTRNVPNDAPFYYVSMPTPWPFIAEVNSQMDIESIVRQYNIGLVIIDNLGTISGDIEENSAQMVKIMAPLRKLATETRAAIILIHHPRKGGANGGRAGDALRGHSVIEASLDYAVSVTDDIDSGIITLSCTKARRFRFDDIRATFNYTHREGTADMDTAWFSAPTVKRGQNNVKDAIMEVLEANGQMTQGRLQDTVYEYMGSKVSKPKIKNWMEEMVAIDFTLSVDKGENNAKIYSIK